MDRLDRIVIRALLAGRVAFDADLPGRFATMGEVRFLRSIPKNRWSLVIGLDGDYELPLGKIADTGMKIASRWAAQAPAPATDDSKP